MDIKTNEVSHICPQKPDVETPFSSLRRSETILHYGTASCQFRVVKS